MLERLSKYLFGINSQSAAAAAPKSTTNNSLPPTRGLTKTQSRQNFFRNQSRDYSALINKIWGNDPSFTLLNLNSKNIAFESLVQIFEALKHNHTITTLDLSYVVLDLATISAMSQMLKINNCIKKLIMIASSPAASVFSTGQFGGKGAVLFSEALKSNTGLSEICLRGHQDLYIKCLAAALEINQTIISIDLDGATFRVTSVNFEDDHQKFFACLDRNQKLQHNMIVQP